MNSTSGAADGMRSNWILRVDVVSKLHVDDLWEALYMETRSADNFTGSGVVRGWSSVPPHVDQSTQHVMKERTWMFSRS